MYWDIHEILPFNRCFNFINGERSIGKTYSTLKFIINRAITRSQEFIYVVRTVTEKKDKVFSRALNKILDDEYADFTFKITNDTISCVVDDVIIPLGYCIALSEVPKIKKRSYPSVKYIVFDEYMLEASHSSSYVTGWAEPDLLLSLYHTVDRESDRVSCFLLGNNTSFYNPYHLHPAFNIPQVKRGETWKSDNVLFHWCVASPLLRNTKNSSKFVKMISSTRYGQYAAQGDYVEDVDDFISPREDTSIHRFSFVVEGVNYGVWHSKNSNTIFISDKYDPSSRFHYALSKKDHSENVQLSNSSSNYLLKWLASNFKSGNVRYVDMLVKKKTEKIIYSLI